MNHGQSRERRGLSFRLAAFSLLIAGLAPAAPSAVAAQPCDKAAFEGVVSAAGTTISTLNAEKKTAFQDGLKALKARAGWSEQDYVVKATPYVKDERTAELDRANADLLAKVQTLGAGGDATDDARCAMLAELQTLMDQVVANTRAKWEHMIAKVTEAAPKPVHAGAAQ